MERCLNISGYDSAFHLVALNIRFWVIDCKPHILAAVSKSRYTQADDLFRELLKETRVVKNLTQADVAGRLDVPQSYVSKYESGERRLDFVETALVCQALRMSIEEFAAAYSARLGKTRPTNGD
ncbi:MAG: helix-turn-helix domain-containing protein [Verrucomicrobiales bacterium]